MTIPTVRKNRGYRCDLIWSKGEAGKMALINRPPRGKEVELKLKDSQKADVHIGILLGLGLRNNEEIGRKIGYSAKGVQNRRNGVNALLIAAVEQMVKHEIDVSRRTVEKIAAEDLKKALGERAGKVVANLDEALDARDSTRRDRATFKVASALIPRNGGGKGGDSPTQSSVYNVSIGSLIAVQQSVQGKPITIPDIAKIVDVTPGERR